MYSYIYIQRIIIKGEILVQNNISSNDGLNKKSLSSECGKPDSISEKKKKRRLVGVLGLVTALGVATTLGTAACGPKEATFSVTFLTSEDVQNFESASVSVKEGTTIADVRKQLAPVDGYEFKGFFKNKECSDPFSETDIIDSDTLIYVEYEEIKIKVNFHMHGKNDERDDDPSFEFGYFDEIKNYELPVPEDYSIDNKDFYFLCWETRGSTSIDMKSMREGRDFLSIDPDREVDLYARFTILDDNNIFKIKEIPFGIVIYKGTDTSGEKLSVGDWLHYGDYVTIHHELLTGYHFESLIINGVEYEESDNDITIKLEVLPEIDFVIVQDAFNLAFEPEKVSVKRDGQELSPSDLIFYGDNIEIKTKSFEKDWIYSISSISGVSGDGEDGNFVVVGDIDVKVDVIHRYLNLNLEDDGTYSVLGLVEGSRQKNIVIPDAHYNGYQISKIADSAFSDNDFVQSVVIGNNVKSVGVGAFAYCGKLASVTIGSGVDEIFENAFYFCEELNALTIGEKVKKIGSNAFYYCGSLFDINFEGDVENWLAIDFDNVSANPASNLGILKIKGDVLESLNITGSVKPYALSNLICLKNVTFGESVNAVQDSLFYGCNGLVSVDFSNINSIGSSAFYNCGNLSGKIDLSAVDSIGTNAFYGCKSIEQIVFGDTISTITESSFARCSGLTSLTLGRNIKTIEQYAFSDCTGILGNLDLTNVTNIENFAFDGCSGAQSVTFGDGIKTLKSNIFSNCTGLTTISLQTSVTSVEDNAFLGCVGLESVVYGGTLNDWVNINFTATSNPLFYASSLMIEGNKIENLELGIKTKSNVFYGYKGLKTLTVTGVATLVQDAFSFCSNLEKITISTSLTSIGDNAFYGCTGINEVIYEGTLSEWVSKINFSNGNSNPLFYAKALKVDGNDEVVKNIELNNATIGAYSFYGYKTLSKVEFSTNVRTISKYAFYGCSSIKELVLGNISTIKEHAFELCSGLNSLTVGSSVGSIEPYAFYDCYHLVKVINKSSRINVQAGETTNGYVGFYAHGVYSTVEEYNENFSFDVIDGIYYMTDGEDYVVVGVENTDMESYVISSRATKIANFAFAGLDNLKSIVIGENIKSIGESAFENCVNLQKIILPSNVTEIGASVFKNCVNLAEVDLSEQLSAISDHAFENCVSLKNIILTDGITSIGSYAFVDCDSLVGVVVSNSVNEIKDHAFSSCDKLEWIVIGSGVNKIESNVLLMCNNLKSVFYYGTDEAFELIDIVYQTYNSERDEYDDYNEELKAATKYFYCHDNPYEKNPDDTQNYWHYENDGEYVPTVWQND